MTLGEVLKTSEKYGAQEIIKEININDKMNGNIKQVNVYT